MWHAAFQYIIPNSPIIGINNDDRPPAKSFSLIHELVHLLKRESSVCNAMYDAKVAQKEEVFCNAVAGELLVPRDEMVNILHKANCSWPFSMEDIANVANKFSVSREVIIRRLLDSKIILETDYTQYNNELKKEYEMERIKRRSAKETGKYYGVPRDISRETIDRTSPAVCQLLYYGYCEEFYSKRDIAHHLGIASKHIDKFLEEVSKWNR